MMEEKRTIFTYLRQVFATYGIIVLIFTVFSLIIGESTEGYSSLFFLGREGLTISTLLQLLLLSVIITIAQVIFLTDVLITNLSIVLRNVLFFTTVLITMIIMIVVFGWFPTHNIESSIASWAGFIICFVVSMGLSVLITRLKERTENAKMQEALDKYNKRN